MRHEPSVTGTMLRDVVVCERRAWHDLHSPPALRDAVATFVRMLWEGGVAHERDVLAGLDGRVVDLRGAASADRAAMSVEALERAEADHLLGAEIELDGLLGRPDVISMLDGCWVAGDVKAGTPYMPDGARVKAEYGVQIGLYARILGGLGLGAADRAFVIGADGRRAVFDLEAPWGATTIAELVDDAVGHARRIAAGDAATRGEASAKCGLCHWRTLCRGELEAADDLTLIAEVGRSLRARLEPLAATRGALAALDVDAFRSSARRAAVPGVGLDRLERLRDRAVLQTTPGATAYAREPLGLARSALEWHLDIEADPLRGGLVYLHGVWERRMDGAGGTVERFVHFFGDGEEGERAAFADAWRFLISDPTARVYYYSRFERTSYRVLQRRHPQVCSAADVEAFFAEPRVVDLYTDVVRPRTEWPLSSYGLKPIAKSLGFRWAAEDASGAASIGWYDEWVRGGDLAVKGRIVDYNRSDVIASAVVLDGLIALPVRSRSSVPPSMPPAAGPAPAPRSGGAVVGTAGSGRDGPLF